MSRRLALGSVLAAWGRRRLWRTSFALAAGGLTVTGRLPAGGCVVVANHSSHADTAALLAALPAGRAPVVAAAADHWFGTPVRATVCRTLTGGRPVRRDGGGWEDLLGLARYLRRGRVVVVFPEGTRSRDGDLGRFRSGAFRLAAAAGVPVVPAAVVGTADVLPVAGRVLPRRRPCEVRFGDPVEPGPDLVPAAAARVRQRVVALLAHQRSAEGLPGRESSA
jgi:1-acyl-sn-glycerol-3-phosphate acyltransferase